MTQKEKGTLLERIVKKLREDRSTAQTEREQKAKDKCIKDLEKYNDKKVTWADQKARTKRLYQIELPPILEDSEDTDEDMIVDESDDESDADRRIDCVINGERWRCCQNYLGYDVSDFGNVYNVEKQRMEKQFVTNGLKYVNIYDNSGKRKCVKVNSLLKQELFDAKKRVPLDKDYVGVYWDEVNQRWLGIIKNDNGRRITKSFAVSSFTDAKRKAVRWRKAMEILYGYEDVQED